MTYLKKLSAALLPIALLLTGIAHSQTMRGTTGVVVSTNEAYQTITVRDDNTNSRDTYFVGDSTELSSSNGSIEFDDVKVGQAVTLKFSDTDIGRDVSTFIIGDPNSTVEIVPVTVTDYYTVKGEITGTRPAKRTITILPEGKTDRVTINVPLGTDIILDDRTAKIEDLSKGEIAQFKYRETDTGYVLVASVDGKVVETTEVVGVEPTTSVQQSRAATQESIPAVLPATASNHFVWLLASLSFLLVGLGLMMRASRKNAA